MIWDHIAGLLADPALIRAEIAKRLEQSRTSNPVTRQRKRIGLALAKTATSITAMVEAFSERLITIDELRDRMPHLRARETSLRGQLDALDAQAADRDAYLELAEAWKASSPAPRQGRRRQRENASRSCTCWSKTSLSARRRSRSATASRSADQRPAAAATTTQPTRRVTCVKVMHCVGGIIPEP